MRIKPTFEAVAKANEVENLRFVAVNTQAARDVAMHFQIQTIPQFHAFVNNKPHKMFKGANEAELYSMVSEVAELVSGPSHKQLNYKQFRPMNLAPRTFFSTGQVDKMKAFFLKFIQNSDVQKEAASLTNISKWAEHFDFEQMPKSALDELIDLVQLAEDKSKIALIDLLRLVITHEPAMTHVAFKHWCALQESVIGYLMCFDLNDEEGKALGNFCLISLKMFCNFFATEFGKKFMQSNE